MPFDAQGAPTQAALAFAKSCGVPVEALSKLNTDKGAWLQFRGTEKGAATTDLLGGILTGAIAALPIAKRMRWGSRSAEFVRPVHAVTLLYGESVVSRGDTRHDRRESHLRASLSRAEAHHLEVGQRLREPAAQGPGGRDFAKRRELIRAGVNVASAQAGGRP